MLISTQMRSLSVMDGRALGAIVATIVVEPVSLAIHLGLRCGMFFLE